VKIETVAEMIVTRLKTVGCKSALRLAELAITTAGRTDHDDEDKDAVGAAQMQALAEILDDLVGDEVSANELCEIF
jgi:hypothetical protein